MILKQYMTAIVCFVIINLNFILTSRVLTFVIPILLSIPLQPLKKYRAVT